MVFSVLGAAVAGLAVAVWLFSRSGQPGQGNVNAGATPPPSPVTCETITDLKQRAACEKTGFSAWSSQQWDSIILSGRPERCGELNDASDRDGCRMAFLEGANNAVPCSAFESPAGQADCKLLSVVGGDDFTACDEAAAAEAREACRREISLKNRGAGLAFCEKLDAAHRAVCAVWYWKNTALVEYDPRVCQKIADRAEVKRCQELFPPDTDGDGLTDRNESRSYSTDPNKSDTDNDGLGDFEEVRVYQTDPNITDTDGDTFSDGQEVQNGFNPKGPGRMPR